MTENKQFKIEFDGHRYFLVIDEVNERCLAGLDTIPDAKAWLEIYEMLSDENHDLKQEITSIRELIGNMMETEKTKLGKSVLIQLWEQIR